MNNIRAVYEAVGENRAYNSRAGNRSASTVRGAGEGFVPAKSGDPWLRSGEDEEGQRRGRGGGGG